MIEAKLSEFAAAIGAEHRGADAGIRGIERDSRTAQVGRLFVAIAGARFDAHEFAEDAVQNGAAALLVERWLDLDVPQLKVRDSVRALGLLARWWQRRWRQLEVASGAPRQLVAVTGSNGKTTTKQLLAAVLVERGPVLATEGNLNNHIGVPVTLLALGSEHRTAVIEMGANHAGEIAYLCGLAEPDIGIVTNVGPAHLEGFGTIDGVARAKGEMFAGLRPNGTAIVNSDAGYDEIWRNQIGLNPALRFGLGAAADVTASGIEPAADGVAFELDQLGQGARVSLPLPGQHNVMNALAVAAVAAVLDIPATAVARRLAEVKPAPGRLQMKRGPHGSRVIDDSYNANPESLRAGVQHLLSLGQPAWLVLGEMSELGADAAREHRQIGVWARRAGVARIFTYGGLASRAAAAFEQNGQHFRSHDELATALITALAAKTRPVTLLVKGSRTARMDRIVSALTESNPKAE